MHMDVLSVGGKDYVKANVIAKDLGYTADYVGQLCRSRKVDAKLVGRSWYVDRNSIHLHRTNRYRSTQAKSIETLKETLEVVQSSEDVLPVHIRTSHSAGVVPKAYRAKTPAYIAYSDDPADLLPKVMKDPVEIPVGLADAESVSVKSSGERYVFQTPELQPIKFQGKLKLTNIEDELIDEKGERGRRIHPKWVFGDKKKKALNLAKSAFKAEEIKGDEQEKTIAPVPPKKTKQKTAHLEVSEDPLEANVPVDIEAIEEKASVSRIALFASFATSLALVLLVLVFEQNITVADGVQSISYSLKLENLTASAYTAYEDLSRVVDVVEFSTMFFFL